jgi:hypothetical protein
MTPYPKNSPQAAMRLVLMPTLVERELTPERLGFLAYVAEKFGMIPDNLKEVLIDYEQDVLSYQNQDTEFFFGDGAFPKSLVHAACDQIDHLDLQLQIAHTMKLVVLERAPHTAKEVAFVEKIINYWGIRKPWHTLLKAQDDNAFQGLRAVQGES